MPKVIGIIPARLESKRLPGKLLLDKTGKPLIVHTIEQAKKAKSLDELVVATDSLEIFNACSRHCRVIVTSRHHENGTTRCMEAFKKLVSERVEIRSSGKQEFCVVNIQGDQPEITPEVIDAVVENLQFRGAAVSTAACKMFADEFRDRNVVKVVYERNGRAMYFSRSPIPHDRPDYGRKHLGVYAFTEGALYGCSIAPESWLSEAENLEQLRWMACGVPVFVCDAGQYQYSGIDSADQYAEFCERFKKQAQ